MNDIVVTIGTNLWELRHAAGLAREALAEASGVSAAAIRRIEEMTQDTRVETLDLLAEALGTDITAFFRENEDATQTVRKHTAVHVRKACLYPKEPSGYHCCTLRHFIGYLPLFDRAVLEDVLLRIQGQFYGSEKYVLEQLERAYLSIPDTPSKQYADIAASLGTPRYKSFMNSELELDAGYEEYNEELKTFLKRLVKGELNDCFCGRG